MTQPQATTVDPVQARKDRELAHARACAQAIEPHIPEAGVLDANGFQRQITGFSLRQLTGLSTVNVMLGARYIREHPEEYEYPLYSNQNGYCFHNDGVLLVRWIAPREKSARTLRTLNYTEMRKYLTLHGAPQRYIDDIAEDQRRLDRDYDRAMEFAAEVAQVR